MKETKTNEQLIKVNGGDYATNISEYYGSYEDLTCPKCYGHIIYDKSEHGIHYYHCDGCGRIYYKENYTWYCKN